MWVIESLYIIDEVHSPDLIIAGTHSHLLSHARICVMRLGRMRVQRGQVGSVEGGLVSQTHRTLSGGDNSIAASPN